MATGCGDPVEAMLRLRGLFHILEHWLAREGEASFTVYFYRCE